MTQPTKTAKPVQQSSGYYLLYSVATVLLFDAVVAMLLAEWQTGLEGVFWWLVCCGFVVGRLPVGRTTKVEDHQALVPIFYFLTIPWIVAIIYYFGTPGGVPNLIYASAGLAVHVVVTQLLQAVNGQKRSP